MTPQVGTLGTVGTLETTQLGTLKPKSQVLNKAQAFLLQFLADSPKPSVEVFAAAAKEGISKRTLWLAASKLGVITRKVGNTWCWLLPSTEGTFHNELKIGNKYTRLKQGAEGVTHQPAQPHTCPACGTELDFADGDTAACLGCGRGWKVVDGRLVEVEPPQPPEPPEGSPEPPCDGGDDDCGGGNTSSLVTSQTHQVLENTSHSSQTSDTLPSEPLGTLETTTLPDWWWETAGDGGAILPDLVVDGASTPEPTPAAHQCPVCGTELDFTEGETAACVGCGRGWRVVDGRLVETEPPEPPDGSPEPPQGNPTPPPTAGGGNTSPSLSSPTQPPSETPPQSPSNQPLPETTTHQDPLEKAKDFLLRLLADGAKPMAEVMEAAKQEGISENTLRKAKRQLKVATRIVGNSWCWLLPSSEGSPQPPEGSPAPAGGGNIPPSHPSPTPPFPESAPQSPTSPPFTESPSHQSPVDQLVDTPFTAAFPETQSPTPQTPQTPPQTQIPQELHQEVGGRGRCGGWWGWQCWGDFITTTPNTPTFPTPYGQATIKLHHSNELNFTDAEASAAEGELPQQPESPCVFGEDVLKYKQASEARAGLSPATAQEGEGCAKGFAPAQTQQVSQAVLAQPSPAPIQQTPIEPPQQQPPEQPQPQTPPSETPEAQPQPQTKPQRMTTRLNDGSIVFNYEGKKETVAAGELDCWKPIDEIDEIPLPSTETLALPPTIVLDIETTSLDAESGVVIAVGLLFHDGESADCKIFFNGGGKEKQILKQTFASIKDFAEKHGNVIFTGYNIFKFDLPFLIQKAEEHNLYCPFRFLRDRETGEIIEGKVAGTKGTLSKENISYPAIVTDLPLIIIDTQHLVCKWDYVEKVLRHYDLKSVAEELGVAVEGRPILPPEVIQQAYRENKELLREYLKADLRETYEIFKKLIPPYLVISKLTNLPLHKVVTKGTAWMWEQILKQHYNYEPPAEEKVDYEGGLTASREGLWYPSLKLDIASLYPTIMLAYRIHSRKDTEQVALRWLKTLTKQRLALKAKAKEGDETAKVVQEGMKILINSLYGFYGTDGCGFNDMEAAAKIPKLGRKILTQMIAAAEDAGGIVVEADTDGIIVCYPHADPQTIFEAVQAAVPPPFKIELEWKDAICFVSDKKNYIVLTPSGEIIAVKGSKWRGRDKEAYSTKAIPTFLQIYATKGKEEAQRYADSVKEEISSGRGWDWVVRSHKVGKSDKFLIDAGFKVGEKATYAYKNYYKRIVSTNPSDGYDVDYYTDKFQDLVDEVKAIIEGKPRKDKSKEKSKRAKKKS